MEQFDIPLAALPLALSALLETQPAVVVSIERLDDEHVLIRALPDVEPQIVARAQVTLAKYHEALMNLS